MTRLLNFEFAFNMHKERFNLLDHPDILLISCVVFSTKLLYPFDGEERAPVSYRDPSSIQIDWNKWGELMRDPAPEGLERRDINNLQPEDAWTMSDRKIDDYLDWFEETQIKPSKETQELRELFPLAEGSRRTMRQGLAEDEIDERMMIAQGYITSIAPSADEWVLRAGENHAVYRSVEDLPDLARAFYIKAADLAGLSLAKLVKGVYTLERSVRLWSVQEKKAAHKEEDDQAHEDN